MVKTWKLWCLSNLLQSTVVNQLKVRVHLQSHSNSNLSCPFLLPELPLCRPADSSSSPTSGLIRLSSRPSTNQEVDCSKGAWAISWLAHMSCPPLSHWELDWWVRRPIIRFRVESHPLRSRLADSSMPGSWPITDDWADGWPTSCSMVESLRSAARQDDWSVSWPIRGLKESCSCDASSPEKCCKTGLTVLSHCWTSKTAIKNWPFYSKQSEAASTLCQVWHKLENGYSNCSERLTRVARMTTLM